MDDHIFYGYGNVVRRRAIDVVHSVGKAAAVENADYAVVPLRHAAALNQQRQFAFLKLTFESEAFRQTKPPVARSLHSQAAKASEPGVP